MSRQVSESHHNRLIMNRPPLTGSNSTFFQIQLSESGVKALTAIKQTDTLNSPPVFAATLTQDVFKPAAFGSDEAKIVPAVDLQRRSG